MSDIFLSYAREDEDRVRPIVEQLEAQGWSVFWDNTIPPGKVWDEYIEQHLNASRCVVVVWSKHSVNSHWVREEARAGREKNILVPIKIDQVESPFGFGSIQAANLSSWNNDASHPQFRLFLNVIASIVPKTVESKIGIEPSRLREPVKPEVTKEPVASKLSGKHQSTNPKKIALVRVLASTIIIALISLFVFGLWFSLKPETSESRISGNSAVKNAEVVPVTEAEVKAVPAEPSATVIGPFTRTPATATVQQVVSTPPAALRIPENFVLIKGGTFTMGSPESEEGHQNDETRHKVTLSDFAICKYEVTVGEYLEFVKETKRTFPDTPGVGDHYPVVNVSWNDAVAYGEWLTKKQGDGAFRLPTEAEWEYACRAGTTTPFSTGENLTTDQANYNGNFPYRNYPKGAYREKTVPVDSFQPNGYGLYNMHGNAWEWCHDWYGSEYYSECLKKGVVENPQGPSTGSARVLRGGSWYYYALRCRSAYRGSADPGYRLSLVGFRLVFVPQS